MQIKNLVFDIGGVLLTDRSRQMLLDSGLAEEDASKIAMEVSFDDHGLWEEWEKNDISIGSLIYKYRNRYPEDAEAIEWYIRHGEYTSSPRPIIWKLIHKLKPYYNMYLLSNYPDIWFHKHTQYADFIKDMDGMEISYMHHLAKPDTAIYQMLCDRYSLIPEECIFFDDKKENTDAAIKFGMYAETVTDQNWFIGRLRGLLYENEKGNR